MTTATRTMFRIRRIHDTATDANRKAIASVQEILRERFPSSKADDIDSLPEQLSDPLSFGLRAVLLVAEGARTNVRGFAVVRYAPDIGVSLLDYLSSAVASGGGIGGALYESVRQEAQALGCTGLFFECRSDVEPGADAATRKQNRARLRFYERYGATPILGTGYETQVRPGIPEPYFLMFDDLGSGVPLRRATAVAALRAVLERSYRDDWPADHVDTLAASFVDDPVRRRAPRYLPPSEAPAVVSGGKQIMLVINDRHQIHHVRERGYVETPVRIPVITKQLEPTGLFHTAPPRDYAERLIRQVHAPAYVDYLKSVCADLPPDQAIYPEVFPIRNRSRQPKDLALRAGYYCMDGFTPLTGNAFLAARRAVDCALTGADYLLSGKHLAYALVRPPGHHAERSVFGGFCYFNNAAIAAHHLSQHGRVAMLDVDYHAGNGQQDIFYRRKDVLTLSIHAHPRIAYPHFSGFEDERGEGDGAGFHRNYPLGADVDGPMHLSVLTKALRRIRSFRPEFLVVPLGFDTAKGDPAGGWSLKAKDFGAMGKAIGALKLPTLCVQEGGYRTRTLGVNARHFFTGLCAGSTGP